MCTFHYDAKTGQFTNRAFNFYVWPRPFSRSAPDLRFMCQTTSIDFLAAQNFDFNKLFRDGISYLRPCDEERIKESICEKQQLRKSNMTPGGGSMGTNGAPFIVPEDQKGVWSLSEGILNEQRLAHFECSLTHSCGRKVVPLSR